MEQTPVTRRAVVAGGCGLAAAAALTACAGYDASGPVTASAPSAAPNEAAGSEGFGFDPVFVPEGEKRTVAQLGNEWKREHSHRARAARDLLASIMLS